MKFKVGDRVRIVNSGNVMPSDIGKEFVIYNITNKYNRYNRPVIVCSKDDYSKLDLNFMSFCENDVELVENRAMTVNEIKKYKTDVENEIKDKINTFMQETGVVVSGIDYSYSYEPFQLCRFDNEEFENNINGECINVSLKVIL